MEKMTLERLPEAFGKMMEKLEQIESMIFDLKDPPAERETFLNIQEAAKHLRLAVSTVYGKVSRMEIPVNKKGKNLYFVKEDLTEWVKNGKKNTREEIADKALSLTKKKGYG